MVGSATFDFEATEKKNDTQVGEETEKICGERTERHTTTTSKDIMKVTVCFGPARFVVPCPPEMTVRKLEQEAIIRYKRKVSLSFMLNFGLLHLVSVFT